MDSLRLIKLMLPAKYDFLPRFCKLSLTNILSNIMIPLASLISIGFLGHLEELHDLAGVLVCTVFLSFIYNTLAFIRMSTTGVTAQAVGRNDREEILLVGLRNCIIAVGIGGLMIIFQYPLREIGFLLMNATPDVKASAIAYFNNRIWEAPAILINFVLIGWFLGQEQSSKVLLLSVVGNSTIIILDYLFVVQYNWGSAGAGISQAVSQYLVLLLGVIFISMQDLWKEIFPLLQKLLNISSYKNILSLSGNLFIKSLIGTATFAIFNSQSAELGTLIFAENSLIFQVAILSANFTQGFGYATETLTGIFKGQGANEKLINLVVTSTVIAFSVGLIFSLSCILFPRPIFGLLTSHEELMDYISIYIPWLLLFLVSASITSVIEGYFLGLAEGSTLRNAAILSILVGFMPFDILGWQIHNNHLLWLGLSLFMTTRILFLGVQLPRTLSGTETLLDNSETIV